LAGFVVGPSKKKTVPVGCVDGAGGEPPGHAGATTFTVRVTGEPAPEGLGVLFKVTFGCPPFTTWVIRFELDAK
jgi:hypothetical protein